MYLPKKPPSPKYSLTPFLFLYVVLLMNGELFSTSSMDRLHVTLHYFSPTEKNVLLPYTIIRKK